METAETGASAVGDRVAALVRRAQSGDDDAFAAIVRAYQDIAIAYSTSILGDRALAEDQQEHDADAGDEELAADAPVDEVLIAVVGEVLAEPARQPRARSIRPHGEPLQARATLLAAHRRTAARSISTAPASSGNSPSKL